MGIVSGALVALGATAAALGLVSLWQRRGDTRRREAARVAYQDRRRTEAEQRFLQDAERYYPFIGAHLKPRIDRGERPIAALRGALASAPGVTIGTTEHGLPAILADSERTKHLWIVARSGFGKTTIMTHMVASDLAVGRGLCAICCETEWFRGYLLALVPESRARQVIYFAPGRGDCPLTFNPLAVEADDDPTRVAAELSLVLRRAVGEEQFGVRTGPIATNALNALVGRPEATLENVLLFFSDDRYRNQVLSECRDPYVVTFFRDTYPRLPKGSELPLVYRLDQLLGRPSIRRCLCQSNSSFSIHRALTEGLILFVDLGNLDPDSQRLIGGLFLSQLQLAAFRRERVPQSQRTMFPIFIDELQVVAAASEAALLTMLARGRRMGLALCAANQHPGQLSKSLRDGLLGTISSLAVMNVDAADAASLRKELLYVPAGGGTPECVPVEHIVTQRVGQAVCRFGSGAFSLEVKTTPPIPEQPMERGAAIRRASWQAFGNNVRTGAPAQARPRGTASTPTDDCRAVGSRGLSDAEVRFLKAVVADPGRPSAEYARAAGLNGTRAAAVRKGLVARGLVREHRLARKASGQPALIIEPLAVARDVMAAAEDPK